MVIRCCLVPKRLANLIDTTPIKDAAIITSPQRPTVCRGLIENVHVGAFVQEDPLLKCATIFTQSAFVDVDLALAGSGLSDGIHFIVDNDFASTACHSPAGNHC